MKTKKPRLRINEDILKDLRKVLRIVRCENCSVEPEHQQAMQLYLEDVGGKATRERHRSDHEEPDPVKERPMGNDSTEKNVVCTYSPRNYPTGEYVAVLSDGSRWHAYPMGTAPALGTGDRRGYIRNGKHTENP